MRDSVNWQFMNASLRFKKVDVCGLYHGAIPFGEMVVMESVQEACRQQDASLNMGDVSRKLCVSKPAVSQILGSLERKGYIVRDVDKDDRRRIMVRSTQEGELALANSRQCYEEAVNRLLGQMTDEELATLVRLMDRLADIHSQLKNNTNL